MNNLPIICEIDQCIPAADNAGIVVINSENEHTYCKNLKLIGGFIILTDAKVKISILPNIKAEKEMTYHGVERGVVERVVCYYSVGQVMFQQNDISRTTTLLKKEDLSDWMILGEKTAQEIVNDKQAVKNKETLDSNAAILVKNIGRLNNHEMNREMDEKYPQYINSLNIFQRPRRKVTKHRMRQEFNKSIEESFKIPSKDTIDSVIKDYTNRGCGYNTKVFADKFDEFFRS